MNILKCILSLIFIVGLAQIKVSGQSNFFPPGAEWYYSFKVPGLLKSRGYTRFEYTGDVELGGRNAKRLDRTTYILDYDQPTIPIDTITEDPFYMAQSSDSIFYFADSVYQLLWINNAEEGDQFEFSNSWGDIFQMNVDSNKIVMVDNQETMKMWISGGTMYGHWGHSVIYDRFGPVNGFLYYSCWGWYDCYDSSLCRYKSDATGVVDFNGSYCDNLLASSNEPQTTGIHVFPNPVSDVLYISSLVAWNESIRINLFNQAGQLVYADNIPASQDYKIDMSTFTKGMYYCRVGAEVFKVIKL
ncbi:MAG TPA: T9SS type A sorting domain-containing protein [Saprospiraceae bacterium]|jgi:type IX secretion system substrate protein